MMLSLLSAGYADARTLTVIAYGLSKPVNRNSYAWSVLRLSQDRRLLRREFVLGDDPCITQLG
jgi:hypothetical protein